MLPNPNQDPDFDRDPRLLCLPNPPPVLNVTGGWYEGRAFWRAMYVGLWMRAWLIMAYSPSHSSVLRLRNMTLLLVLIFDLSVGGERMEMSRAVPRRSGTSGVSSKATRG